MDKTEIRSRQKARKLILQALYQWHMAPAELSEIEAQFCFVNNMSKVDVAYFEKLLYGVPKNNELLLSTLSPYLDIPIENLNPIELTVLRMATYELLFSLEIPSRIILDEAVSLNKEFGSKDGFRFVNGVLNNLARKIRPLEFKDSQ